MADVELDTAWRCGICATDNSPEHCLGQFAYRDYWGEPLCVIDGESGYCVCGCEDCNPSVCQSCGNELGSM